jgi:predicted NAD-dependent protein-ADP-ribosyltransferase YbiA (DUF1768 family)
MLASSYLFAKEAKKKKETFQDMALIALPTGSTELGILAREIFIQVNSEIEAPNLYLAPISIHNGKKTEPNFSALDSIKEKKVVLIDDNVSSGKTLQLVIDYLKTKGVKVVGFIIAEADLVRSHIRKTRPNLGFFNYSVNRLPVSKNLKPGSDLKKMWQRLTLGNFYLKESDNFTLGSIDNSVFKIQADLVKHPTSGQIKKNPEENKILSFRHTFLSNFEPCKIAYNGCEFPSVEHAYQFAKFARYEDTNLNPDQIKDIELILNKGNKTEELFKKPGPGNLNLKNLLNTVFKSNQYSSGTIKHLANYLNKILPLDRSWREVKLKTMLELCTLKFTNNPDLKRLLLQTGDKLLVEGNDWGDEYWGFDFETKKGRNYLGRILMHLRDSLTSL